ncbi:acetaldehyde dehydrogenase (acetylating) [Sutcliffiella horikoshii]|uniref:Acetaldehyde dehydrogenase n=1 Tax=Sutcliffiella horikoshii TaxID=79883 RepID=A0A5D4TJW5_9BACI|nr:acetaldehyde dehydrogenase (acetylating) [Sutcliffiella horikoshii]TYS74366.1 acetaldehyde dehydrogenase (acetylating) [Sutcliffiella horikoshii]
MGKVKVAIIGSGNIGTDLMLKLHRSKSLELTAMIGIDPHSDGLRRAKAYGHTIIMNGVDGFLEKLDLADILFDATSAKAHYRHAKALSKTGKHLIDLTPAAIGPFVVPTVNLLEHINKPVVNMVTCGGQATIPIIHAVSQVCEVEYAEIVATIASKSAGPGTRMNIDEFTTTTARAMEEIGGAKKGKAIIILNPAEPPILMRDTVYCQVQNLKGKEEQISDAIARRVREIQEYVPGYRLRTEPIFDGDKVSIFIEVKGAGDYLPDYSGNLDIMTAAAVKVGEEKAIRLAGKRIKTVKAT